jgi:cell division initiation protein
MNYTPNDLQNVVFKKAIIRGYAEDAVHEVMDKVVEDYNALMRENIELKDKVAMLNEGIRHYKNIEESLQNTLIMAQTTSEDVKKNTAEKVDNMIREAQLHAKQLIVEANKEVDKINQEYEEIRKKLHVYKSKSESLLMSQLEMLKMVMEESN